MEGVVARLPHPVRVAGQLQQRCHHGARVPHLDLAPVAAGDQRVRPLGVELHVARGHDVRGGVDEAALHGARVQDAHARARHQRNHAGRVRVPAPGRDGGAGQLARRHRADHLGRARLCGRAADGGRTSAPAQQNARCTHKHTQAQRASTPQMRKPASSTVARPRPPCTGHSTLAARESVSDAQLVRTQRCGSARTAAWSCRPPRTPPRAPGQGARAWQAARRQRVRGRARKTTLPSVGGGAPLERHGAGRVAPQRRAVALAWRARGVSV